jgi:protein gp37
VGAKSKIEWLAGGATWNVATGCDKVSSGCKNCYAERIALDMQARGVKKYADGFALRIHPEQLHIPLSWGRGRPVFVNSMSDFFHAGIPFEILDAHFAVMALAQRHVFIILTKRPERAVSYFEHQRRLGMAAVFNRSRGLTLELGKAISRAATANQNGWFVTAPGPSMPLPNVIIGISAEDQDTFNTRCRVLADIPAALRCVSLGPLLGPIDAREYIGHGRPVGWVIAEGETGDNARQTQPDWLRLLQYDCATLGVPFFFKQWGEWGPISGDTLGRLGRHNTGNALDLKQYLEFPEVLQRVFDAPAVPSNQTITEDLFS